MKVDKEAYQLPYTSGCMASHDHFCNTYRPFLDLIVDEVDTMYRLGEFCCGEAKVSKALMYLLPKHKFNLYDIPETENSVKRNLKGKEYRYDFVSVKNYKDAQYKEQYHSVIYSLGIFNFMEYSAINKLLQKSKPYCNKMVHLVWSDKAAEIFDYPIRYMPMSDWIVNLNAEDMFFRNFGYYYLIGWRGGNV